MPRSRELLLLHLSDIHLKKAELQSGQDVDSDIRARLLDDLAHADVRATDGVDAILVTGDIAYAADADEYGAAYEWLKQLCGVVKCKTSAVWLVPGNHDVQQSVIKKSVLLRDLHDRIRKDSAPAVALADRLGDEEAKRMLLQPFAEYNKFAGRFGSETLPDRIEWDSDEDLAFDDGTPLVLRGLNSCLVSNHLDQDIGKPCQVIGLKQVQLPNFADRVFVTLCHHPPDWLHDQDQVVDHLTTRARIQLFGHKHLQRVRQVDNSVVMVAGALHPDRKEGEWLPRYNLVRLAIANSNGDRHLEVAVHPRAWCAPDTAFGRHTGSDGEYPKNYKLKLKPSRSPPVPVIPVEPAGVPKSQESDVVSIVSSGGIPMREDRQIVYDLFELSFPVRMKLFLRLDLVREEDAAATDAELVRNVLARAREGNTIALLREAVAKELAGKR